MKLVMNAEKGFDIPFFSQFFEPEIDRLESLVILAAHFFRSHPCGITFEDAFDRIKFFNFSLAEIGHDRTLARNYRQVTFGFELPESFPDRGATDPETFGQFWLSNLFSGLELTTEDGLANRFKDPFA